MAGSSPFGHRAPSAPVPLFEFSVVPLCHIVFQFDALNIRLEFSRSVCPSNLRERGPHPRPPLTADDSPTVTWWAVMFIQLAHTRKP